jgi:hypothetical protein
MTSDMAFIMAIAAIGSIVFAVLLITIYRHNQDTEWWDY